tara:strand:- start:279 stop:1115 length:837 start_codon:yes stop_codon:yes gene_type:complete
MPKMGYDIICIMYAMLRNLIILSISLSVHSTLTQSAELTLDITSYTYREVDPNDNFFMEDKSAPFLYSLGLRNWGDDTATSNTKSTNFSFLYTLEYSFGNVDYSSAGTGTMKKQYYKSRLEYYLSTSSRVGANDLLPYIGLGYRDLLDDSGFKTSSTNHLGYDRLSKYYYVPIGAIWYISDRLSLKSQYNYFLEGKQISFLNEILPNTYTVNPENTQRLGWGIDLTLRSKLNKKWSTYGFFRSWNVEDSDSVSCSALVYCMEPKNQTHEIGAGISYHF